MNKTIAIFTLMASAVYAVAADAPSDKKAIKKKQAKTAVEKPASPVVQPLTIPKDAVPNPNGTYSYTDKNGAKWIFSKTAFGVSRVQDMGNPNAGAAQQKRQQYTTATDNGDTVKFVRQTPFGPKNWEKKKSELTDEERQILEAQQSRPAAPETKPE